MTLFYIFVGGSNITFSPLIVLPKRHSKVQRRRGGNNEGRPVTMDEFVDVEPYWFPFALQSSHSVLEHANTERIASTWDDAKIQNVQDCYVV